MASSPFRETEGGWTLRSLVGTFLDLALAYLCLCAAAAAFFAAKFLGVFGIPLPCSCDGHAAQGHLHSRHRPDSVCLHSLLLDYPTAKIAGVHMSLRRRFPFDTLCRDCYRRHSANRCCCSSGSRLYDVKLVNNDDSSEDEGGRRGGSGRRTRPLLVTEDGEESCGSVSKPPRASVSLLSLSAIASGEVAPELETNFRLGGSTVDVKGKGVLSTRHTSALRHRRRGQKSLIIRTKSPPVSPSRPLQLGWQGDGATQNSVHIRGQSQQVAQEGMPEPSALTPDGHQNSGDHDELVVRAASAVEYNSEDKDSLCREKIMHGIERNELGIIRYLKKELEEEKAARSALLLELEKERNSSATAADEAMAMIFRLQEEKAAIEMEARQYKRMAEEKSVYDEEEMDILKEIIVRRERETHVLEKEIESYRETMLNNNGVLENDAEIDVHQIAEQTNLFQSSDDTELMLKEIYKSIKKDKAEDKMQYVYDCGTSASQENILTNRSFIQLLSLDESVDISHLNHDSVSLIPFGKKHQRVPYHGDECKVEEKWMVTTEDCASSLQIQRLAKEFHSCMREAPVEDNIHELTSHLPNEEKGAEDREIKMRDPLYYSSTKHDPNAAKINSKAFQCDNEMSILDVHVIDLGEQRKEKEICLSQVGCASNTSQVYDMTKQPILRTMVGHNTMEELNLHRSCSDSSMGLSANYSRSYPISSTSDLRRRSMSCVDSERFKLENEVEILRKRLKIIQEGREKLSVSLEQREKEINHLRVLEEISCQLHEIRKATETGKSTHRASLPPSSSKVTLKERRCSSMSIEQQEST